MKLKIREIIKETKKGKANVNDGAEILSSHSTQDSICDRIESVTDLKNNSFKRKTKIKIKFKRKIQSSDRELASQCRQRE